ncbi:ATP-binding cassette domain-containing protein, partial [Oleiphilus sp. HI0066]|uniref:ATP-binding cassette domain-containing protein n=3 Tax=unclassified Oleiphilus TaxID=2631174 RepID=UPI000B05E2A1
IDLRQIDPADLRRNIGVVTQIPQLLSGTIRDSIVAALPSATDEDILKAVERSGVGHFVNQDPEGLDRDIGEQGRFLSLGQRQTLAIARALLPDPPILIFDEPSSNLDKSSEKKLIDQLAVVGEGKTMIFLTHNLEMLKLANKVLVLDGGRVAMMGDKEEVLARLKGLGEQPNTQSDAGGEHV